MADIKHILGLIFLVTCLTWTNSAQAELVAYYPFDGDLNDYSGNGKNGVYWSGGSSTATPTFVTGQVGQAISLHAFASYGTDGVGSNRLEQGVILPNESYFDFVSGITVSCWVKFNSVMTAYPNGWFSALVTKSRASDQWSLQTNWNTGAQRAAWRIGHTDGSTSTFTVRPGTTDKFIHLGRNPADWENTTWFDTWYHIVGTYDSTTGWSKIYLDGQLNISFQRTGADRSIGDRNNIQAAAAIGIYAKSNYTPWGTGDSYSDSHDGLIDEVAIYDNALTPEEVATIYTKGPIHCGMTGMTFLKADISGPDGLPDCYIDLYDLAVILENWLECTDPFNPSECPP